MNRWKALLAAWWDEALRTPTFGAAREPGTLTSQARFYIPDHGPGKV